MLLCLRLRLIFSHCLVFHVDISVGQAGLMVSLMKYVYFIVYCIVSVLHSWWPSRRSYHWTIIIRGWLHIVPSPAASCVSDLLVVSVLSRTGSWNCAIQRLIPLLIFFSSDSTWFKFEPDWLKLCSFTGPSTQGTKAQTNQSWITIICHTIENCCVVTLCFYHNN